MARWALALLASLVLSAAGPATAPARVYPVETTPGIVYGHGQVTRPEPGAVDLLLDLYEPVTTARRRPAVVLIHGGGFRGGTREQAEIERVARGLASRGVLVANIDYRINAQGPVPSPGLAPLVPAVADQSVAQAVVAAVDDTLTAVNWLRSRATELRVDPHRIGLIGASAGAITACHVAYALDDYGLRPPRIQFVGDLWGGILLDTQLHAAQLETGEAPLFAVHGSADTLVAVVLDDRLVARARTVGVQARYYRVEGGEHSFEGTGFFTREVAPGRTAFDGLLRFARRRLRERDSVPPPPGP
jgi:acetyl esterase/lipase